MDEIMKLEAGRKLDTAIAEIMEPKPAPISARELRKFEGSNFQWVSTYSAYSPLGWWRAEIGTDHNIDFGGNFRADMDDAPVAWHPAKEPSIDISAAWQVVEKMNSEGFAFYIEWTTGIPWAMFDKDSNMEYSAEADTAPLAICISAYLAKIQVENR